jgi:N-acetylglucosamine kinase-like BadF-type ATPase
MNVLSIGIDAGGTKTEFRSGLGAEVSTVNRLRGANLLRDGVEETVEVLSTGILRQAASDLNKAVDMLSVCAGISGVESGNDALAVHKSLMDRLLDERQVPDTCVIEVEILHDAVIAMEAAFEDGAGAVFIVGTGSVVLLRKQDGTMLRSGGWGRIIGDDAGGYALGRAGLRAVASAFDSDEESFLRRLVADKFDITEKDHLIQRVYREKWPLQNVADTVLTAAEQGDETGLTIVRSNVEALEGALHERVPNWRRVEPLHTDPGSGAFARAQRNADDRRSLIPKLDGPAVAK